MLTVITGPPCGGKTTHVAEHRNTNDLVLDLDAIAHALGYPERQIEWGSAHPAVAAARSARGHLLYQLLNGKLRCDAWVIDAKPDRGMLAQYRRAGARIINVDPGREVCLDRAASRSPQVVEHIEAWYGAGSSRPAALGVFR